MLRKTSLLYTACALTIVLILVLRNWVYDTARSTADEETIDSNQGVALGLAVHYHERRPYYHTEDGRVRGLCAEPIALAFNEAQIPFHWRLTPAARQLELIRLNQTPACAAGWFKTPDREQFARFSLPIYRDRDIIALSRADNELIPADPTLEDLIGNHRLRLLVKTGYTYGNQIDQAIARHRPRTSETTSDNRSMLLMVLAHRADYFFLQEEEATDLLQPPDFKPSDFRRIRFPEISRGPLRYVMCSNLVPEDTLARLNESIQRNLQVEAPEANQ